MRCYCLQVRELLSLRFLPMLTPTSPTRAPSAQASNGKSPPLWVLTCVQETSESKASADQEDDQSHLQVATDARADSLAAALDAAVAQLQSNVKSSQQSSVGMIADAIPLPALIRELKVSSKTLLLSIHLERVHSPHDISYQHRICTCINLTRQVTTISSNGPCSG